MGFVENLIHFSTVQKL